MFITLKPFLFFAIVHSTFVCLIYIRIKCLNMGEIIQYTLSGKKEPEYPTMSVSDDIFASTTKQDTTRSRPSDRRLKHQQLKQRDNIYTTDNTQTASATSRVLVFRLTKLLRSCAHKWVVHRHQCARATRELANSIVACSTQQSGHIPGSGVNYSSPTPTCA